jgi:hypothetical protein
MNIKPTTKSDVCYSSNVPKTLNTSNPARFFFPSRLVFIITSQLRVLKTNRYIPPIKVR